MIKKSLITALVLLGLHALFVHITHIGNSQHIWQDNINKAQRFIYNTDTSLSVIVGSSLSNRLIMDSLQGFYNLSLQGQNIYDGLAIILKKHQVPKKIYLEMNIILGVENRNFTGSLFSPIQYNIRKIFPSLRDEYQPVGQFSKIVMNSIDKIHPGSKLLKSPPVSENVFKQLMELKIREYSQIPDDATIQERKAILKKYVQSLENEGAKVVFFEMPVNEELVNLPRACIVRKIFFETFPEEKYRYIPVPDCKNYKTRDGEHLGPEEALVYTCYFKSLIMESNLASN